MTLDIQPGETVTVLLEPMTDLGELAAVSWNYRHREAIERALLKLRDPRIIDDNQRRPILSQMAEEIRRMEAM